jgi:hypothetical protein
MMSSWAVETSRSTADWASSGSAGDERRQGLGERQPHEHVPRIAGSEDQRMHLALPPGHRIGQQAQVAEVQLALRPRLAVGNPDRRGRGPTVTAAFRAEPVQRPVRHRDALPLQQDPIFTTVRPCFTHAWTSARQDSSRSHACPCPPGRTGRTASATCPTSSSVSCPGPPSRASPAATAASTYRRAVLRSTPACAATFRSPAPASHDRSTSRIFITLTSRNTIRPNLRVRRLDGIRAAKRPEPPARHAGWSHHWQPGGPIPVAENPSERSHDHGRRHGAVETTLTAVSGGSIIIVGVAFRRLACDNV